jgi:hypothetical protein
MSQQAPQQDPPRHRIEWLKVVAGALAAVSSAVALSTLGAAGTIIGAALGSVIASIASSLYTAGLERSRAQLAETRELARQRLGVAQAEVRRAARRHEDTAELEAHLEHADRQLAEAKSELTHAPERPSWRDRFVLLPWRRIGLVAGALFLIAVVVITVVELIANRPVSDLTGGTHGDKGTSFTNIGGGGGHPSTPRRKPTPTPTPTPSSSPSATPSTTPSPSPTDLPTVPPSEPITPTPTPTPEPSATATDGS